MSSLEVHTLAWPNVDPRMVQAHTEVCKRFGWHVTYHIEQKPHGQWMDEVMASSTAEIVGFLDIDCIPTTHHSRAHVFELLERTKTFVGLAQVSNHIPPGSHIYAAPACFFMYRKVWEELDRPTFRETQHSDVAENVCYMAEIKRKPYATLFPTGYLKEPDEGLWRLHTYGVYGIGTMFAGGMFHLYQGRLPQNVELFCDVADAVLHNDKERLVFTPCRD